jgi:MYXO-CTERM domain-containing protein
MLNSTYPLNVTSTSPLQSQPNIYFSPFGSGPNAGYAASAITNVSGSTFFVYTGAIAVDPNYTSGANLSATGTISGNFASRGITVGTSTTQFRLGDNGGSANTLIVQRSVASASVPDQMPTAALGAGVVLMGLAARRRRR